MVELDEKKKKSGGILASSLCFKIKRQKHPFPKNEKCELYVEIDISSYHKDIS